MLRNIYENKKPYNALNLSESVKDEARKAFNKGIDCILKTQIKVDGHPTVWCAQHDENTFEPAAARAYELPSFSGAESVGIVRLLMSLPNPSQEVISAVKGAVDWFEKNKKDTTNMVVVSTASPYKFPQDVLYAVTGNDVRDSFKGIKRLHAATAMAVPKSLSTLRDKTVRFNLVVSPDKMFDEVLRFVSEK